MKSMIHAMFILSLMSLSSSVHAQINCEGGVEFYPNGGIKSCVLTGHHQVYTQIGTRVICANGKTMAQHPDGKLKACVLKETQSIESQQCDAGASVEFDTKGHLMNCRPG